MIKKYYDPFINTMELYTKLLADKADDYFKNWLIEKEKRIFFENEYNRLRIENDRLKRFK